MNALTTWRTTWYLDNKWRDSNIESILEVDFSSNSSHSPPITAANGNGEKRRYWKTAVKGVINEEKNIRDLKTSSGIGGTAVYSYVTELVRGLVVCIILDHYVPTRKLKNRNIRRIKY